MNDFRKTMQLTTDDYINPEKYHDKELISNILIYLGVDKKIANNPRVSHELYNLVNTSLQRSEIQNIDSDNIQYVISLLRNVLEVNDR